MVCVSDLKFIMPMYSKILHMAFTKMSRNDYLLTAALLGHAFPLTPTLLEFPVLHNLNYDQYEFSKSSTEDDDCCRYRILLNAIGVGT